VGVPSLGLHSYVIAIRPHALVLKDSWRGGLCQKTYIIWHTHPVSGEVVHMLR
jgi:type IV secretory pathway protease TraF